MSTKISYTSKRKNSPDAILDAVFKFLGIDDQQALSVNIGTILALLRNVFASYFDLLALDDSDGILGGIYRDAPPEERKEAEYAAWEALNGMGLLSIAPHGGPEYFFAALTMSEASRLEFEQLPRARKFHIALQTKRIFVNGEKFHGYGLEGLAAPDQEFWPLLLAEPGDGPFARGFPDLEAKAADLFAFEQISDFRGGDSRLIDNLESRFFNFPAKGQVGHPQFYWELRSRALRGGTPNKRLCYSGEMPFLKLQENLCTIMAATRDVFATSRDLLLLDRSHGVLGGGATTPSSEENVRAYWAEQEIRDVLQDVSPFLPVGSMEAGFTYFLPALTMPLAARVKFAALSDLDKFKVALKTKRVFVNGDAFMGYGGSGKPLPDPGFWSALFEFDAEHACSDAEIAVAGTSEFAPGTSLAFWLERCIDRDVGHTRLMDQLDLHELCAGRTEKLVETLVAIVAEFGWRGRSDCYALKYFGAVGNPRG